MTTLKDNHENVSEDELLKAYKIAAIVVSRFGEVYLPVFERLNTEVEIMKKRKEAKMLAIQIASE